VAKETAETLRMYEKTGEESDAIVDKILAASTVLTKTVNTETRTGSTIETEPTKSRKK